MSKNLIFICVFCQEKYVNMAYLLLESIYVHANLDDNTDILIYTSTTFMNMIKKSSLMSSKLIFQINDNYNNINLACKSRLDLFDFPVLQSYSKILYLDTDIIVISDMNILFNISLENKLYVLEEGSIDEHRNNQINNQIDYLSKIQQNDFWGSTLFDNFTKYIDRTAFTTGILLFNNCNEIRNLFATVKQDIINRPIDFGCYDQPYIVFNAFNLGLYNNKMMKLFSVNNDENVESGKIIHHFPGGPGFFWLKMPKLIEFLMKSIDAKINHIITLTKKYINENLLPIILETGEQLEGNIFMEHLTTTYSDKFTCKSKNICKMALNSNISNALEIGFNAGFSTLLMLISNPKMKLTCLDLGEHAYTLPCYNKLKETFGNRINLIIGNSNTTLPTINNTYDLIHIDGGHSNEVAAIDITNSYRLSRGGTILIMDDYDFPNLHRIWDSFVKKYNLQN